MLKQRNLPNRTHYLRIKGLNYLMQLNHQTWRPIVIRF
jgi:hypothetical protein